MRDVHCSATSVDRDLAVVAVLEQERRVGHVVFFEVATSVAVGVDAPYDGAILGNDFMHFLG